MHAEEERYVETVRMWGRVVTMLGAGVSVAVVKRRMVVLVVRLAKREPVAIIRWRSREEEEKQK